MDASTRRYQTLIELAAMDMSNFGQAVRRVLEADAEALDVARVNCWQLESEPQSIRCVSGYRRARATFESGEVLRAREHPRYFRALDEDPIIIADDAQVDPRTSELAESYLIPQGITSMMDVPVWVRGALWGVVCNEHVGPARHWTQAERDFALSIGHIISIAVEARERVQAEEAARFSELFVGVLSHDLRNPLGTIRASAASLQGRTPDEASRRAVQRILRTSERMTRMVDQLLDFTRIRTGGGLPVRPDTTDLAELCRRVASEISVARPGCAIELQVSGDPVGVWDPDRIWQLLWNLVLNALEHGKNGNRAWLHVDGRDPEWVLLKVRNRGAIPAEQLPRLFEPFQGRGRPRVSGGLGLGLFISRAITTAHAGTIGMETGEQETVFTVRLPRHPPYVGEERSTLH